MNLYLNLFRLDLDLIRSCDSAVMKQTTLIYRKWSADSFTADAIKRLSSRLKLTETSRCFVVCFFIWTLTHILGFEHLWSSRVLVTTFGHIYITVRCYGLVEGRTVSTAVVHTAGSRGQWFKVVKGKIHRNEKNSFLSWHQRKWRLKCDRDFLWWLPAQRI